MGNFSPTGIELRFINGWDLLTLLGKPTLVTVLFTYFLLSQLTTTVDENTLYVSLKLTVAI